MAKSLVFISHIAEEAALADILQKHLRSDFLGMVDIFVSSDGESIRAGSKWLDRIDEALKAAEIQLILCSGASVQRPWINFEAGAEWIRGVPVVPICHTDMKPSRLPIPLKMLQAICANEEDDLKRLYALLAHKIGSEVPKGNYRAIATEIRAFEQEYGLVRLVREAVNAVIEMVPEIAHAFMPGVTYGDIEFIIDDTLWPSARPYFDELIRLKMVQFEYNYPKDIMAGFSSGIMGKKCRLILLESYQRISNEVTSK